MTRTPEQTSFEEVEKALPGAAQWIRRLRLRAIERFAKVGYPTSKDEEWKRTDLGPIAKASFAPARASGTASASDLEPHLFAPAWTMAFVDGRHSEALSSTEPPPRGVTARALAAALDQDPALESRLASLAPPEASAFAALNAAFATDGAVVEVARGSVVEVPIHLLFVTTSAAAPKATHVRSVVVAGERSEGVVVESHVGLGDAAYLSTSVTEIFAGEAAVFDHVKVQREGPGGHHVGLVVSEQGRASTVRQHQIALGAALARQDVTGRLAGEGAELLLNGLFLADGSRHLDHHTRIEHVAPRCSSREVYKGVLDDRAHGVFDGLIYVHKGAQKTDAKQTNKNLLLSDACVVDSNPRLEIFADDVKCTHGSTIGQIEEEHLFYLRSRGLDEAAARSVLTYGFAEDAIRRIRSDGLRTSLERELLRRLPAGSAAMEALGR